MEADLLPMIAVDGARIAYRRIGNGIASQLGEIRVPVLIATGTDDIVIPASKYGVT